MTVQEMLHKPTIERCVQEIATGLDVHRWLKIWKDGGMAVDEKTAIGFYHQALQDAREAIRALSSGEGSNG